ncbi:DNA repair and recombination protein RAD54B, partial [Geosmithia morbida]
VFMKRRDELECFHEPFGEAFYYGPESTSKRFEGNDAAREASGAIDKTYLDTVDEILGDGQREGKRIFVKDMAYYLMPPDGQRAQIAPSLGGGVEAGNPTVVPLSLLRRFHFTFLIRHPRRSIPSYYRTTIPPLRDITNFEYMPGESGYDELVRLFDFLVNSGVVGRDQLTVIDADDMLDDPEPIIREYCRRTDIDFSPDMLEWDDDDRRHAQIHFAKWNGFHDDAIHSNALRPRTHEQKKPSIEAEDAEWLQKYGPEGQRVIRKTVDANISSYNYLKQFCIKPQAK